MAAGTGFPYVLYDLLKKESSSVVMWTSTGTAFGIRDMTSFRQDVLTCYFKHNKFSSFQRQLNLYGFRKVVKGRESGCYMHPAFLRDNPERLPEVKRGVVPPCPSHYSRKIYGSGPRFMNQDDGSDSEPELVVQPRGHWEKGIAGSEVATHMRLGEMHISAAALAAARAQIKADGADVANSGHAAAAAAAAAHHLQVAQAHIHRGGVPHDGRGNPLNSRGHMMGDRGGGLGVSVGGLSHQSHQGVSGRAVGFGPGPSGGEASGAMFGSGGGGEEPRSRSRQTSLSKMFGGNRPSPGGGGSAPSQASSYGGMGNQSSQQQNMRQQQMSRFNALPPPPPPPPPPPHQQHQQPSSGGGNGMANASPLLANVMGQEGGVSMGGGGSGRGAGGSEGAGFNKPVGATAMSLSRLLDGLGQTLDSPSEEELYTPIDKRNSFCAQMVNIAQVLEEDPSMQGIEEHRNNQFSYLAQKRRSSVSELAAYLHDMLEEGESNRMMPTAPGWLIPLAGAQANNGSTNMSDPSSAGGQSAPGSQSRVTFKRMHGDDYNEAYGGYGVNMKGRGRDGSHPDGSSGQAGENALAGGFTKRVKGSPLAEQQQHQRQQQQQQQQQALAASGGGEGERDAVVRRVSANGRLGMGASPTVVQALTCLASGLNTSPSDSDGDGTSDGPSAGAFNAVGGKIVGRREGGLTAESSPWATPASAGKGSVARAMSVDSEASSRLVAGPGGREVDGGAAMIRVKVEANASAGGDTRSTDTRSTATSVTKDGERNGFATADDDGLEAPDSSEDVSRLRGGSNAIADVLTNFSIDRAVEQFTTLGAGADDEEEADGGPQKQRQRASVYVLMHAIAAVDTAATPTEWDAEDGQEILDGDDVTTVAAAI